MLTKQVLVGASLVMIPARLRQARKQILKRRLSSIGDRQVASARRSAMSSLESFRVLVDKTAQSVTALLGSFDAAEESFFSSEINILTKRSEYFEAVRKGKDAVDEYIKQYRYKVGSSREQLAPPIREYAEVRSLACLQELCQGFDTCETKESLLQTVRDLANMKRPMQSLVTNIAATVTELTNARDARRKKKVEMKRKASTGSDLSGSDKKPKRKPGDVFELVTEAPA